MQSFVYIEADEEEVDPTSIQIASRIRKIPVEIRGPLKGISIGKNLEGKESQFSGLLDEILLVEVAKGNESNTEVISNVLTDFIGNHGLCTLFLGFTHQGMELAPAVGWRLEIPVVTACTDFEWTTDTAQCKRDMLGGKVIASISVMMNKGAIISVQKGAWKDDVDSTAVGGEVLITEIDWKESWAAEKSEVISISKEQFEEDEDITKAEILVSAGRGLGDPDNLPIINELAENLGGMISCSRPVVDLGWLPASRQVGISGKTVAPVIYLALGISGQSNHVAGMNASGTIIAVNKDPSAPIFNIARYGIVDDLLEFVPELIGQLRNQKSA
jgi:electron transfer flavoprotein alpha subunit